jgi:hypothetical protein
MVLDKVLVVDEWARGMIAPEHKYLVYTNDGIELVKPTEIVSIELQKNDIINRP